MGGCDGGAKKAPAWTLGSSKSNVDVQAKLRVLADAAKYDASCASSGSKRARVEGGIGNTTGNGTCHSYTPDGRCVSLLKLLLTNYFDATDCERHSGCEGPGHQGGEGAAVCSRRPKHAVRCRRYRCPR